MKFFYDSIEDAQRRLTGTVVLHKGDPVMIHNVIGMNTDQMANVIELPYNPQRMKAVSLTSSEFEIRQLPQLGYVDHKGWSYYITRIPVRQGKQGFHEETTEIPSNHEAYHPTFRQLISTKEFISMLMGRYPKFQTVFDEFVEIEEPTSKAFKKTFSLSCDDMGTMCLNHRGTKVAVATDPRRNGPVFKLPKQFKYLTEELNELGIKAA